LTSLVGLSLLLVHPLVMPSQSMDEQAVLAALALNIVRYTTWPAEAQDQKNSTIDFCVVGDNVAQESFSSIDNKPVGDKTIHIIFLSRLRNYQQCRVLYISELKQNYLLQVFSEIQKKPILTIGESYEFAKNGGMVGLENVDGKITMHVNLTPIHETKLNISARLLKLAKVIGN
jgi:YfiR/HmsC-like